MPTFVVGIKLVREKSDQTSKQIHILLPLNGTTRCNETLYVLLLTYFYIHPLPVLHICSHLLNMSETELQAHCGFVDREDPSEPNPEESFLA